MPTRRPRPSAEADAFARVDGSPGATPRLIGLFRTFWPLFLVFAAAGYVLRAALPAPALSRTAAGLLLLLLSALFAFLIVRSESRLKQYLKGARGEEDVARVLAFLPPSYRVFHGLTPPSHRLLERARDIDHVVVGPTGLFVIETKNWRGPVTVREGRILADGEEPDRPPLDQVRAAAKVLEREFVESLGVSFSVHPVLCFASGALRSEATGIAGVSVCNVRSLNDVLLDSVEEPLTRDLQVKVAEHLEQLMQAA